MRTIFDFEDYQDSRCSNCQAGASGTETVPTDRIISKLDGYLNKNDYNSAKRHLVYWLDEAQSLNDERGMLLICNELIGLHRKLNEREECLGFVKKALDLVDGMHIEKNIGAATTYINAATAYKAFGKADASLPLFEKARAIYEAELPKEDARLGGLYNNMALSLVDLHRFDDAHALYLSALEVMENVPNGALEQAITYLNMASAAQAQYGLEESEETVTQLLDKAKELLESFSDSDDGYYAFVCEKCASVFGYFGYFEYEGILKKRAEKIYERN